MKLVVLAAAILAAGASPGLSTEITVLSFNSWGAGGNEGKGVEETVAVIRAVGADIVGLQETMLEGEDCTADACPPNGRSAARAVAEALGYHYVDQDASNEALWANAILSRYPIGTLTPNKLGAAIEVDGRRVNVFNIHLDDAPYQPYQLMGIEYGDFPFFDTEAEAVAAATATRGPALDLLEADMDAADAADLVLVFGDFNEPSHHDWTEATASAGMHPVKVAFPTTLRLEGLGLVDTFRAVHPDPVAKPGFTWTPTSAPDDPEDHHDRIDFVFAGAEQLEVLDAGIAGEKTPEADIVVTPWPSDHRASYARISF